MARARNIKPGFFKNEDLAECTLAARLCFIGLWTLADREGRLEDRPKRIKGELYPFDSIEVEPLLAELEHWGFIVRYRAAALDLIQIQTFSKHQNPHHREPESELPPPKSPRLEVVANPPEPQALPPLQPIEALGKPEASPGLAPPKSDLARGSSRADSGFRIPESRTPISPTAAGVASLPGFDRFWTIWPKSERKEAKGKCFIAWRKAGCEAIADIVIAHVEAKKASIGWTKNGGEYIPAPLVYLNGRKWEGAEDLAEADQRSFV